MQILYVNVIEQNAGWGAEVFVDRGLRQLGHHTHCIDYRANRHRLAARFRSAPPSEIFFLQRGDGFPLPIVRAMKMPRLFWASELVSRRRDQDRLLRSGLFAHTFFHTAACVTTAVAQGWVVPERASVLLNGFDPTLFRPLPGGERDIDLLFVGTLSPRRRAMLDRLAQRYRLTVAAAFGEDFVRLASRARIVLNIHAEEPLDTETRVYEVLGCGAFLLSEQLSVENPFTDDELVQWQGLDDLIAKIDHYLAHEQARQAIAQRGLAVALGGHTYLHRAAQIAATMAACLAERPARLAKPGKQLPIYGSYEPLLAIGARLAAPTRAILRRIRARLLRLDKRSLLV